MANYTPNGREAKVFKGELLLEPNDFSSQKIIYDKEAIAKNVQNLLFFRKGNFPNQPNLGVGIEDYIFDLGDTKGLMDLQDEINSQINQFIDTENVKVNVYLKLSKNQNSSARYNNLIIYVGIAGKDPNSREHEVNTVNENNIEDFSFSILLSGNKFNRRIASKLVL